MKLSSAQEKALKVILNRRPCDPYIKGKVHQNTIYALIRNNVVELDIFGCYSLKKGGIK